MVKKGLFLKVYYFFKFLMFYFVDRVNFICILSNVMEFDKYIINYELKFDSSNSYFVY